MNAFLLPVLVASVGGSLHCAAMCGPTMALVSRFAAGERAGLSTHAAYHFGRLTTYLALGAFGGLVGGTLDLAGDAAGLGRVSALVAGLLLVVWGASALVPRASLVSLRRKAPQRLGSLLGRALAWLARFPPLPRALLLGLSTTLVPCGWLYAFVAAAAGTGSPVSALGVMFAFWLGTLPALAAAGLGLNGLLSRFGGRARTASAVLIAASGVVLLALRVDVPSSFANDDSQAAAAPVSCPLHTH
jgi:sulfite exporter TauE/SafE